MSRSARRAPKFEFATIDSMLSMGIRVVTKVLKHIYINNVKSPSATGS